mmetsp:Transcript_7569/g.14005  ORF Transcript_7569/g.14005 Transcript_7569/m.14005 type:complete len:582 (+) Transcript_7569:61-1806(+)
MVHPQRNDEFRMHVPEALQDGMRASNLLPTHVSGDGHADPVKSLLLMSWNVAGWKTTMDHIRRFKGGFPCFIQKHHVDILCLQEAKLTAKSITGQAIQLGVETPGYESFWACNEGSGAQRQGLNGVATFAREGTVLRADAAPLQVPDLDREGRCLLTDHGHFVLFNVYVPNHAGGSRLPFKMRWLHALQAAMRRERSAGKSVILAGDLNMKHRNADSHWTWRRVSVAKLGEVLPHSNLEGTEQKVVSAILDAWPEICALLRAKEHRPIETRNSRNGQTFKRWGVFVKTRTGDVVRLGAPIESEEEARNSYVVDGVGVEDDGTVCVGSSSHGATYMLKRAGELSVAELVESVRKLLGLDVPARVLRWMSDIACGVSTPPIADWLQSVLHGDDMVDTFAEVHQHAQERFTCWDQYRNGRHENLGSRIDYILTDRSFFVQHVKRGADLQAYGHSEPDSAAAALRAATLGGLSQPSPFAGGGMPDLEEDEYFLQFSEASSTGIIYTPPQLSDHVATSLLMSGCLLRSGINASNRDSATHRCQPHRAAKRITDFFGRKRSIQNDGELAQESISTPPIPSKRINLVA